MATDTKIGVQGASAPNVYIDLEQVTNDNGETVVRQVIEAPSVEERLDKVIQLLNVLAPIANAFVINSNDPGISVVNGRNTAFTVTTAKALQSIGGNSASFPVAYLDLDQYYKSQAAYATIRQQLSVIGLPNS